MSPQLVGILAAIAAEQARVEAMKVANAQVDLQSCAAPYSEDAFRFAANNLDTLSIEARNAQ
jgi:hypothetical protein